MTATSTEKGETAIIGIPGMFWKLSKDGETVVRADYRTDKGRWELYQRGQKTADYIRELETDSRASVATEELAIQWITAASLVAMLGG